MITVNFVDDLHSAVSDISNTCQTHRHIIRKMARVAWLTGNACSQIDNSCLLASSKIIDTPVRRLR